MTGVGWRVGLVPLTVPIDLLELVVVVRILVVGIYGASPSGLVLSDSGRTCHSWKGTTVSLVVGCAGLTQPRRNGQCLLMCEALFGLYLPCDIDSSLSTAMRGCWRFNAQVVFGTVLVGY